VLPLVVLSASGSIFIGLICGVAVVFSIEFIDKIKIDDPVGLFLYTVYVVP
jgi:ammonia channel protein AmtB